jgi:hypothetical protein
MKHMFTYSVEEVLSPLSVLEEDLRILNWGLGSIHFEVSLGVTERHMSLLDQYRHFFKFIE